MSMMSGPRLVLMMFPTRDSEIRDIVARRVGTKATFGAVPFSALLRPSPPAELHTPEGTYVGREEIERYLDRFYSERFARTHDSLDVIRQQRPEKRGELTVVEDVLNAIEARISAAEVGPYVSLSNDDHVGFEWDYAATSIMAVHLGRDRWHLSIDREEGAIDELHEATDADVVECIVALSHPREE